jgi:hypothetical protein
LGEAKKLGSRHRSVARTRQSNCLPEKHSRNSSPAEAHASVSSFQGPFCHTPHRLLKPGFAGSSHFRGANRCVSAGVWEGDSRKGHPHMPLLARRFGEPLFSGPPVTSDSSSQPRRVVHYRVDYWLSPSWIPTRPRRVHVQRCRKEPMKNTARHILRATFTGLLAVMAGAAIPPSVNSQGPELVTFSRLPDGTNHVNGCDHGRVPNQLNMATQNSNYQHA